MKENADAGAAESRGYSAAEASHMFEDFLEYRIGHDHFWEWLMHYPGREAHDPAVEDVIDRATLALRAFQEGYRSWGAVHHELLDCRGTLTGLARL